MPSARGSWPTQQRCIKRRPNNSTPWLPNEQQPVRAPFVCTQNLRHNQDSSKSSIKRDFALLPYTNQGLSSDWLAKSRRDKTCRGLWPSPTKKLRVHGILCNGTSAWSVL